MYTGALPATSIYETWSENVEVWSADDDELIDLADVTEITLKLRDPRSRFDELTLYYSTGDIVIVSTGIIQWRAEQTVMGALAPQTYKVILTFENGTDTLALVLGSISVVE